MVEAAKENDDAPVKTGEVLAGKYRVEKVLGKGGMGVVVLAMHIQLRQRVALKFLLPDANREVTQRFAREARAAARLRSQHVAKVLDVGELPTGAPYMVLEYLEGSDLSRVLRKRGALSIEDAVEYVLQACEAIAEAHVAGIIHRDLKPANLFLTTAADGSPIVKVLDFGISKDTSPDGKIDGDPGEDGDSEASDEEMALTRTTAVLGSPAYMAPEQMKSTRSVDTRADIWSLGVILYALLTKQLPYRAPSFVELVLKVNTTDPPPLSHHRMDIPAPLDEAILRCLRRDREHRFATVSELALAIAPYARPAARASAERIARTQGAPLPLDAPTQFDHLPPAGVQNQREAVKATGGTATGGASLPLPSIPPGAPELSAARSTVGGAALTGESIEAPRPTAGPEPSGKTAAGWTAIGSHEPVAKPKTYLGIILAATVIALGVGGWVVMSKGGSADKGAAGPASADNTPVRATATPTATATSTVIVAPAPPPPVATATASASASAASPPATAPAGNHAPPPAKTAAPAGNGKKKSVLDMDIQ